MVITSIIQYCSSSLQVETKEAEIFNSKLLFFFLASKYETDGEFWETFRNINPTSELPEVTRQFTFTFTLKLQNGRGPIRQLQDFKSKEVKVRGRDAREWRRRGRDEGRKWRIKRKKITELSERLIDCDKGNLGLNFLNDAGTHLNDRKTIRGIEIWWRYVLYDVLLKFALWVVPSRFIKKTHMKSETVKNKSKRPDV